MAAIPGLVMPLFAQKMFGALDSYTLLALPYFILAGSIMSAGGISQQLVDFARLWWAFPRRPRPCLDRRRDGVVGHFRLVDGGCGRDLLVSSRP